MKALNTVPVSIWFDHISPETQTVGDWKKSQLVLCPVISEKLVTHQTEEDLPQQPEPGSSTRGMFTSTFSFLLCYRPTPTPSLIWCSHSTEGWLDVYLTVLLWFVHRSGTCTHVFIFSHSTHPKPQTRGTVQFILYFAQNGLIGQSCVRGVVLCVSGSIRRQHVIVHFLQCASQ